MLEMGSNYDQLKQLLVNSIIQVCQQQSFYIEQLKVEGTLCLTSDGASVLVTQITEHIGEKHDSIPDLPQRVSSFGKDEGSTTPTLDGKLPRSNFFLHDTKENLENIREFESVHSIWKNQRKSLTNYNCPFCKKIFRFKHSLKDHLNKHTGKKPYVCKHCALSFPCLANLCKHTRRRHSKKGSMDYKCPLCKECFFSVQTLKRHCTLKHKHVNWTKIILHQSVLGHKNKKNKFEKKNKLNVVHQKPVVALSSSSICLNERASEVTSVARNNPNLESNQINKIRQEKETSNLKAYDVPAEKEKPVVVQLPVHLERRGPTTRSHTQLLASASKSKEETEPSSQNCPTQDDVDTQPAVSDAEPQKINKEGNKPECNETVDSKMSGKSSDRLLEPGQVSAAGLTITPALAANMMAQASLNQAMAIQMGGMTGLWPAMGSWFTQAQTSATQQAQVIQTTPTTSVPPSPSSVSHPPSSPIASVDQVAAVLSEVRKDSTTGKFPCPYCNKSYRYKHTLKDHLNNHTGMRPHVCDICGSSFIHLASLCAHIKRLHSNEHIGDFKCPACKQAFRKMASLKQHITWQHKEMQSSTMFDSLLERGPPESPSLSSEFAKTLGAINLNRFNIEHLANITLATTSSTPPVPQEPQFNIALPKVNEAKEDAAMKNPESRQTTHQAELKEQLDEIHHDKDVDEESNKSQTQPISPIVKPTESLNEERTTVQKTTDSKNNNFETDQPPVPQFYRDWANSMQFNVSLETEAATAYVSPNEPLEDQEAEGSSSSAVIAQYFDEIEMNTPHGMFKYKCKLCTKMYRHRTSVYDHINTHLNKKPYVCRECGDAFAHHSSLFNHTKNKHA